MVLLGKGDFMKKNSVWKTALCGVLLVLADVLICKTAGFHLAGGSLFSMVGGWLTTLICAGLFFMICARTGQDHSSKEEQITLIDEQGLKATLKKVRKQNPKVFKKEMRELDNQCLRMEKKCQQLDTALKNYFGSSRISYAKFAATVNGGIEVFDENVSRILSRIQIFDEDGYENVFKMHQEYTDAILPYQATFDAIHQDLKTNEQILERFDRLLLEVNKLSDPQTDLDQLPAMQELSALIDQTKLYRQH